MRLTHSDTYCCTRKYVLKTEPPDFVAGRHHLGEEHTEAGIAHDSGKRDQQCLDVELPSQLERSVSKGEREIV